MADERDLVAALTIALDPTPVWWGFAPFESSGEPPTLPMVVVQRTSFSTTEYETMCEGEYTGNTLVVIDAWALTYEQARALATQAREAATGVEDWRLQNEADQFDPGFRAWRIQGQWLAVAVPPT
jgi:hypothetical protein